MTELTGRIERIRVLWINRDDPDQVPFMAENSV